jgi:Flp pilus assembly protein TadD
MSSRFRLLVRIAPFIAVWLVLQLPGVSPATDKKQERARIGSMIKESQRQLAAEQYDSVTVTLDQVRELDPDNPDAFYYQALTHLALADTAQALTVLSDGVERAPLSSRLKLLLARLLLYDGNYDEAESVLNTLLRFKPRDPETLYLRGLVSLAKGDSTQALDNWQTALEHLQTKGVLR